MRQQRATIYEATDKHGFKVYWCCQKLHYWWKDAEAATKCCNGWTPVYTPLYYGSSRPEDWGRWYEPAYPWAKTLIPDFLTDEISTLRALRPGELYESFHRQIWDWQWSSEKAQ